MAKYFCVDESGSYNTVYERYYIISGIITADIKRLQDIHREIEKKVRSKHKGTRELKGANLKDKQKAMFINSIIDDGECAIVSLIIDKKILREKHDFKMSEFLMFNYALKELCILALDNNYIDKNDFIIMQVDARVMNRKVYYDLESYLNLELYNDVKLINVFYKDSAITREIQLADYISNTIYGYFNKTNDTFKLIENRAKIKYRIIPGGES